MLNLSLSVWLFGARSRIFGLVSLVLWVEIIGHLENVFYYWSAMNQKQVIKEVKITTRNHFFHIEQQS
jgi:hypothetical protein